MKTPILSDRSMRVVVGLGQIDVLRAIRCITFIAALLLIWVTLHPFPDLGDPDQQTEGRLASTYITLGMLAALALMLTGYRSQKAFSTLLTPTFVALVCWICIDTLFSRDFGISAQRLVLTGSAMVVAACLPLLPESQAELDFGLGASALILLGLCYLGIILAPSLSIHSSTDILEPQLAGNWRGTFGHKNAAAPIMAMLVYVGLYLVSRKAILSGLAIAILSANFLIYSAGKSAIGLCVLTFLLGHLICAAKSNFLRASLAFLPLLAINLLSVDSVYSDKLAAFVKLLPVDATFTGRTDIWEFAITSLNLRPLFGYGFAAFWGTRAVENQIQNDESEWVTLVSHSHNGYLDTALTIGYPGLALIIAIFIIAPLRDFSVATRHGNGGPLAMLFFVSGCLASISHRWRAFCWIGQMPSGSRSRFPCSACTTSPGFRWLRNHTRGDGSAPTPRSGRVVRTVRRPGARPRASRMVSRCDRLRRGSVGEWLESGPDSGFWGLNRRPACADGRFVQACGPTSREP